MKPRQKPSKAPQRERPVIAVTLSEMALQKLSQLQKLYGKTYASHTVEKIVEDAWAREFGGAGGVAGNLNGNASGHIASGTGPGATSHLNDAPRITKPIHK